MSASLVGSEMCIRDRDHKRWLLARFPEALKRLSGGSPESLRKSPEALPVSYTHLTLPTICSV
eukprot:14338768-Alexandrium_andersonii.AAC.1